MSRDADLDETIDREARDERERRESRLVLDALQRGKDVLGGAASLPAEDRAMSEKILAEARSRSAQIQRGQGTSAAGTSARTTASDGPGVPWWLWLLLLIALAGTGVAVFSLFAAA